ncbi:hypothetical protein BUALT_Bualt04G0040800 [Buddleja alternifolia]|uniref:Uncharacterized protein n=1 Tax=Buddleja alternifolia TaxID=168488 RepID=A0AAV6XL53_9LAMI|nr:hypothetical protein BUALT_Bualt04G0040800 [Buddleja alternifolia]
MEIGQTLLTRIDEKDDKLKSVERINEEMKVDYEKLNAKTLSLTTSRNSLLMRAKELEEKVKSLQNEKDN